MCGPPLHLQPDREDALRLHSDLEVRGLSGDREVADEAAGHERIRATVLLLL